MLNNPMSLFMSDGISVNDQVALNFAQNQLYNLETRIYEKKYPEFDYRRHIPIVQEGSPWAQGTTWQALDISGEAKFISDQSTDLPYVKMSRDQYNAPFYMIASAWEWSIVEMNQAALAGLSLSTQLPSAARRIVERKLYDIFMTGSGEKSGLSGFVNDASVTSYTVPADGTGASTFWPTKTPDLILRDFNQLLAGIRISTNNIEYADAVRLPPSAFDYISTARLGTNDSATTILDWIREKNSYTARTRNELDIDTIQELETAGASGDGRMIAYRKDEEVVRGLLPMAPTPIEVRSRSLLTYESAIMSRTGGTNIRLPGAMRYADRITDG